MSELRKRKYARTRLALATALSEALTRQPFSEVTTRALCREAEVSEATFFNYFPHKQDLMAYLAHLWLLELGWHTQRAASAGQGLAVIDQLFAQTAKNCASRPGVFRELLVWIARGGNIDPQLEITPFEKQLAFPRLEGIDTTPVKGIDSWLATQIEAAIHSGELPPNTVPPLLLAALLAILLGVPLTMLSSDAARIAPMYRQQLALLWAGTRTLSRGQG
ncbi:MAG TPA: TetR/AcrR family transcriptional regulator [Gammaproteobacteria bacterium]|nr:TetR/AcrR family transcriptional regulator [Gammaproteobacteria bacterium]